MSTHFEDCITRQTNRFFQAKILKKTKICLFTLDPDVSCPILFDVG
jgi:hypothetical protein